MTDLSVPSGVREYALKPVLEAASTQSTAPASGPAAESQPAQSADSDGAEADLKLAKAYLATGMKDKGVAILGEVLKKYPGTAAAEAAKLELERLESGD